MTGKTYRAMTERDLKGRKARLLRDVVTRGGQVIRTGSTVTIVGKFGGLEIEIATCKHCGQASRVRKVHIEAIGLLPVEETS